MKKINDKIEFRAEVQWVRTSVNPCRLTHFDYSTKQQKNVYTTEVYRWGYR